MVTSYSKNGKLSLFSTQFPGAQSVQGQDFTPKSLVGFHMKPRARADEAAVRGAGCKIEAVDESGSPIVLLADAHFFYPVSPPTYSRAFPCALHEIAEKFYKLLFNKKLTFS